MTAAGYASDLEQKFSQLPGWLQSPLSPIYHEIDGLLHQVAGNPEELLQAGEGYAQLAAQIRQIAEEQHSDRVKLLAGEWEGAAYDAFSAAMSQVEAQIDALALATGNTREVLAAAAQACTEAANAILEIVGALIMFLISSFVINAVLAVFTFGMSLAADVAEAVADALESLAQVVQVVEKLSAVLEKIAKLLETLATALKDVREALGMLLRGVDKTAGQINEEIRILRLLRPLGGTTNIMRAIFPGGVAEDAGLGWKALYYAGYYGAMTAESEAVSHALRYGSGGTVNLPGTGQELLRAGESADHMVDDAGAAERGAR